jgi:hypothetical protein
MRSPCSFFIVRSAHPNQKDVPTVKTLSLETERSWPPVKSRGTAAAPLSQSHPDQVLTFAEWCALNRLSERTGRRILGSGGGPDVTQLSAKRIGITVGANARWQASRKRA